MGVKNLWKVLRPASSTESLTSLAMDSFDASIKGHAGYRVGIDISIWFGHGEMLKDKAKLGKNHELRIMFFRCARLLQIPILPLFVFDGPKRPKIKRGKMAQYKGSRLVTGMKNIIDGFGFQYHFAPGEAEAELAYLNRIGVIDAVWTDDVDAFLFGATTVIRNPSSSLSGNVTNPVLNAEGRDDGKHVLVFTASEVESHTDIQLTRNGLILVGMLRGGDYHEGVPKVGITLAHRLAQCKFGETLASTFESTQGDSLNQSLSVWRSGIVEELCTNSRGVLGKRYPTLAQSFPEDFPDIDTVLAYLSPAVSGTVPQFNWHRQPDISKLADVCALYFEWDYHNVLLPKFRSLIWPGALMRMLRSAIICAEVPSEGHIAFQKVPNTPATSNEERSPAVLDTLIIQIHDQREHASTDGRPELRIEIDPASLVELAGLSTLRCGLSDSDTSENAQAHLRVWMPTSLVQRVVPRLVDEYTERAGKRAQKRARETDMLAANIRGSSGETGSGTAKTPSNKSARASAEQTSPHIHSCSGPNGEKAGASESDAILIYDSEGGEDDQRTRMTVIDLT